MFLTNEGRPSVRASVPVRTASATRSAWFIAIACGLIGCGREDDRLRIAMLEQEIKRLDTQINTLKTLNTNEPEKPPHHPVQLFCPVPFRRQIPPDSDVLWICRARTAAPEGFYPYCNVVFQPQISIETIDYFEYVLHTTPHLLAAQGFQSKEAKIHDAPGFEVSFEARLGAGPLKALGVLMPYRESTYAVTCLAPAESFASYEKTFRQIIESFEFEPEKQVEPHQQVPATQPSDPTKPH